MSKDLGKRLKELRKQSGFDTNGLAKKLSVNANDVTHWENGDSSPDGEQLIKLSHIYKMPIDEILLNFDTDTEASFDYSQGYSKTNSNTGYTTTTTTTTYDNTPANNAIQQINQNYKSLKSRYNWYMFPYPIIVVFVYMFIGLFFGKWHPTWLIILTIPVYYTLIASSKQKTFRGKANVFPFPILCVILYLALGFDYNLWHPMWFIFFTIPVYYMVVNGFKN